MVPWSRLTKPEVDTLPPCRLIVAPLRSVLAPRSSEPATARVDPAPRFKVPACANELEATETVTAPAVVIAAVSNAPGAKPSDQLLSEFQSPEPVAIH